MARGATVITAEEDVWVTAAILAIAAKEAGDRAEVGREIRASVETTANADETGLIMDTKLRPGSWEPVDGWGGSATGELSSIKT